MRVRRFISLVLSAVYLFAAVFNAYAVLTCDCASQHHHAHHGHTCCAKVAGVGQGAVCFTQHCDCTHSHENRSAAAVISDNCEVVRFLRAAVADLPRICISDAECAVYADAVSAEILFCERKIPIVEVHGIPAAAPRAPSVEA